MVRRTCRSGKVRTIEASTAEQRSTRSLTNKIQADVPASPLIDTCGSRRRHVAVIRGGRVVWSRGFGFADLAARVPVTPETEFNVGSLSKTPTAWGVMSHSNWSTKARVKLDRHLSTHISGDGIFRHPPLKTARSPSSRLLSHTSGISRIHDYHGWDPSSPLPPIEDSLGGKTGTGVVQVVSTPGDAFHYSGANYAILELLIEEVSGRPFVDYMQSRIFQPLHMLHSQYGLPRDFEKTMAKPYDTLEKADPDTPLQRTRCGRADHEYPRSGHLRGCRTEDREGCASGPRADQA